MFVSRREQGDGPHAGVTGRHATGDTAALRARLLELRGDALRRLSKAPPIVDAGLLRLITDIGAVMAALDSEAWP